MTRLYVLDIPENQGVVSVADQGPEVKVRRRGSYFEIDSTGAIVIDRRATGCRHAVWYSCVAGFTGSRIAQWDKDALRVEPA